MLRSAGRRKPASSRARSSAVLSPVAPEPGASALSPKTNVPSPGAAAWAIASSMPVSVGMKSCRASQKVAGQPVRLAVRERLLAGVDDHRAAVLGQIHPRLHRACARRQDAGPLLGGDHLAHHRLERPAGRVAVLARQDHRQGAECLRRPGAAVQDSRENPRAEGAGLDVIDVRLRVVEDHRVGQVDHALRDVGVAVDRRHDRQVRADQLADRGIQAAGAVVVRLGDHRSVRDQQQAVEGAGVADGAQQLGLQVAVGGIVQRPSGGGREGEEQRHGRLAQLAQGARHLVPAASERVEDFWPAQVEPGAEPFQGRARRREGVRLLDHPADADSEAAITHRCARSESV